MVPWESLDEGLLDRNKHAQIAIVFYRIIVFPVQHSYLLYSAFFVLYHFLWLSLITVCPDAAVTQSPLIFPLHLRHTISRLKCGGCVVTLRDVEISLYLSI